MMVAKKREGLHLAPGLELPLEIVTEKLAVLGQSGAGKTYTAKRLAELLLGAGVQVVALDPVGPWWGLRASSDGKHAGFPVLVLGGAHGDLPLSATAGAATARLVVERRISAVVDVSELDPLQKAVFVRDFAAELFERKKRHPSAMHVFFEEAQEFIPEDPDGKEEARMRASCIRLLKIGRNYGVGWTIVSQEPQAVSKRGLGQAGTMIAMRTLGDYPQRVILGWAKNNVREKEVYEELQRQIPAMETGEAFVASPFFLKLAKRVRVSRLQTFDSSRTPEIGESLVEPKVLAEVEVEQLRSQFSGLVEQLEAEDPEALRRRISQLEHELRSKKPAVAPAPPPAAPRLVEVPVLAGGEVDRLNHITEDLLEQMGKARSELDRVGAEVVNLRETIRAIAPHPASKSIAPPRPHVGGAAVAHPPPARHQAASEGAVALRAGERKILATLARSHPVKRTEAQLGTLSGFTPSGGTFQAYMRTLKRCGFVEVDHAGGVGITAAGLQQAGDVARRPETTEEVLAMWRQALRAGERKMLDALVGVYPETMARSALGGMTGFTSSGGTFQAYLRTLVRNGLVEPTVGDQVKASDSLFLGGGQ